MSIAMHELTQPPFAQTLAALSGVLAKAEAHAALKKFDAGVLLGARLAPDMFPLSRQVEIACDLAASSLARLTGVEVPSWRAEAKTIADLRAHRQDPRLPRRVQARRHRRHRGARDHVVAGRQAGHHGG